MRTKLIQNYKDMLSKTKAFEDKKNSCADFQPNTSGALVANRSNILRRNKRRSTE